MHPIKPILAASVAALCLSAAPSVSALNLIADYTDSSVSSGIWQSAGGQLFSADPGNGALNVTAAFKANVSAAFTYISNSVKVSRDLTVTFKLHDFTGQGADGDSSITSVYNSNGLPASSTIRLDSSIGSQFYVDPTPFNNSEYNLSFVNAPLGGGMVNVGRFGTAVVGSVAENRTDVLTLLTHELIHSTALGADTPEGMLNRKLTIPSSLTGLPSNFNLPFISGSNHIDPFAMGATFAHTVTSEPSFGNNDRWLLTGVEIYGICVIQLCTASEVNPNLLAAVPEPSAWLLMVCGLGLVAALRRRRQPQV